MPARTPSHDARLKGPIAPRFSLRALLVGMTLLSLIFAVFSAVGLLWSMAILLLGCLAGAHVLGNSLGTRLRDEATRSSAADRPPQPSPRSVGPIDAAPPRLAERASLHRVALAIALGTAAIGGEAGAMAAAYTYPEASVAAVGLGALSLAVLGGLGGFVAIAFVTVARQALKQAHAAAKERDAPR